MPIDENVTVMPTTKKVGKKDVKKVDKNETKKEEKKSEKEVGSDYSDKGPKDKVSLIHLHYSITWP